MFATLLGALPRPPLPADADPSVVARAMVEAQLAAGLEPLTDGAEPRIDGAVAAWRVASGAAGAVAVKQAVVGPWTRHQRHQDGSLREAVSSVAADVSGLAEAGCPMIEIHEPAVIDRSFDAAERGTLIGAWQELAQGAAAGRGVHLALAVTGGNVTGLGPAVYEAPFASYAFDLRAGPDNWRVIADAPRERGIVVGALSTEAGSDDGPELLAWAVHYAASIHGRGLERIGLATAGSLAHLPWDVAVGKLSRLGRAAEVAARPTFRDMAPDFDPRAAGMKSAALGRVPAPRRRRRHG